MTAADTDALEIAVARTGHARFRQLLDPAHPDHDPRYWTTVRALAGAAAPPDPALDADRIAARAKAEACPHRIPTKSCRCAGYCALGRGSERHDGRNVANLDDCAACDIST